MQKAFKAISDGVKISDLQHTSFMFFNCIMINDLKYFIEFDLSVSVIVATPAALNISTAVIRS